MTGVHDQQWQEPQKPTVHKWFEELALIIPLAILAGCAAVKKPSKLVGNLSQLLAELITIVPEQYRLLNGSVPEATALLVAFHA
ncbi:hypothetical protein BD410DRAFT_845458 [Rickenella mellea]|uniref:Uncharacterized protein n=1 Tax=Rickenella mellea TaxID=50990 RepID=A0A4Y7PI23_9AGAM|nr:hypothetical protein BD410DRAFT_845458 [Rickenella mellea]